MEKSANQDHPGPFFSCEEHRKLCQLGNKHILWKTEGLHTSVSLRRCCMMGLNAGQASAELSAGAVKPR